MNILSETEKVMVAWKQHICVRLNTLKLLFSVLGTIKSKGNFTLWLKEFLEGPVGISYRKDIRMQNGTGSGLEITVRLFHVPRKSVN